MARPKEHTPEQILAAALVVFDADGVGVSTARIAKAAGVSNGTLFNYFPTKQDLIDALYLSIKTELAEVVGRLDGNDPLEVRMRQVWNRWFAWARANRAAHHVANLLNQAGLASQNAQDAGIALLEAPVSVLSEAMESGLLVDLPLEYLGALIQHQLDQAVLSELTDAQAEVAYGVMWRGLTTGETSSSQPQNVLTVSEMQPTEEGTQT